MRRILQFVKGLNEEIQLTNQTKVQPSQKAEDTAPTVERYAPKPMTTQQTVALSIKLVLGATVFVVILWVLESMTK